MILSTLGTRSFRCLVDQEIALHPRMNWLIGGNAAGKTSVLEALHWIGRGKSFRTSRAAQCIRRGEAGWRVTSRIERVDRPADRVAIRYAADGLQLQRNDRPERLVAHARETPVLLVEPGLHRLVEDGPGYRRRFLDWGMFHVEQSYLALWQAFARALRQRNAALRERADDATVSAWTRELAKHGGALHASRQQGIERLREKLAARGAALDLPALELDLYPGWEAGRTLEAALQERVDRDRRQGVTGSGPQRAELRFRLGGEPARQHISRGQQKLLLAALSLAQADVVVESGGVQPLLLLDDFTAELGEAFQERLLAVLAAYPGQSVIGSLERPRALAGDAPTRMFHVEHGRLRDDG